MSFSHGFISNISFDAILLPFPFVEVLDDVEECSGAIEFFLIELCWL